MRKVNRMSSEQILVTNFVASLEQPNLDQMLTLAASKLSESVLQKIWDNPDDAEYDQL